MFLSRKNAKWLRPVIPSNVVSSPTAQSTLYSQAFTLTEAGTVKAIAIKNGVSSEIASLGFSSAQLPQRYSFTLQ